MAYRLLLILLLFISALAAAQGTLVTLTTDTPSPTSTSTVTSTITTKAVGVAPEAVHVTSKAVGAKSYTHVVISYVTKTKTYPAYQTSCPKEKKKRHGVCKDKCMANYMTPMALPVRTWQNNGTLVNATVTAYSTPRWGDMDGKHVPWPSFIAAYVKQEGLFGDAATSTSASMASHHYEASKTPTPIPRSTIPGPTLASSVFGTLVTLAASPTVVPASPSPTTVPASTLASSAFDTLTSHSTAMPDTHHTPTTAVFDFDPTSGTPTSTTTLTPLNPYTDTVDQMGWSNEEKLWMYENWDYRHGKVECYDYQSCYDHCQKNSRRMHEARNLAFGIAGSVATIAAMLALLRYLLKKSRNISDSNPPPSSTNPPTDGSTLIDGATAGMTTQVEWASTPVRLYSNGMSEDEPVRRSM